MLLKDMTREELELYSYTDITYMILKENKELVEILNHPNVQIKDKKHIVETAFKNRMDDEIVELMLVLLQQGKINEIISIALYYRDIAYEHKGIKIAFVTTAIKMTKDEIRMLKVRLGKQYGCIIEIENLIDPEIIGGVYLQIGDEVTDGTIRGNFERMRKELMNHSVKSEVK
jgi:F-type H+-transporting ATPase subunit delta